MQIHITWMDTLGLCDLKYVRLLDMWRDVAKLQEWDDVNGLAMTIISDEMYSSTIKALVGQQNG